jgi:hypothetical protein
LPYLDRHLLSEIINRGWTPSNATAADSALQSLDTEEFRAQLGRIACGYDGGQLEAENTSDDVQR